MLAGILSRLAEWALSVNKPGTYSGEDDPRWAYTIEVQGDPYLTRIMLPRLLGWRVMLHHFHRPDQDRYMHNHPWGEAYSLILCGSYDETRLVRERSHLGDPGGSNWVVTTSRRVRWLNKLTKLDYHRVTKLHGDVWTLFVTGERVQDWGFLVDGVHVPWKKFLGLVP